MGIVETTRKTDEMQRVYYALLCGGSWPYSSPKLNTNIMNTKNYNVLEELSENEIENLFAEGNEETIFAWTEGDGRGQSNYEILRINNDGCFVCGSQGSSVYVLRSEHYGFDDFNQPTYNLITMNNLNQI